MPKSPTITLGRPSGLDHIANLNCGSVVAITKYPKSDFLLSKDGMAFFGDRFIFKTVFFQDILILNLKHFVIDIQNRMFLFKHKLRLYLDKRVNIIL